MNRKWTIGTRGPLALLLLCLATLPAGADEARTRLTLNDVFLQVLEDNEQIGIALAEMAKTEAIYRGARSRLIPSAYFSGRYTRYGEPQMVEFGETEDGDPIGFEVVPQADWSYLLNVKQIVYAGGRPRRGLRYAGNLRGIAGEAYQQIRQQVGLAVAAAYLDIIKAERNLEIGQNELELAQRQQQVAASLFRAGETVGTSVLRAELAVVSAERELIAANNRLERAHSDFVLFTGISGDYRLVPPPGPSAEVAGLDQLLEVAANSRPELERSNLEITNAELMVDIARGEWLPTVTVEGNYLRQKSEFPTDHWVSGVINFSVPIFDGGLARSHLREAKVDLAKTTLQRSDLERRIRSEVVNARLNRMDLQKARAVLQKQVRLARQTYEDIVRFYAAGESTDLDLLEAQRTLISSERMLADVENDELLAQYALEASTGVFIRELNSENHRTAEGGPRSEERHQ